MRHGLALRERLGVLAVDEYRRLKRRGRQVPRAGELPDAELEAIGKAEVPPEYAYLDAEIAEK